MKLQIALDEVTVEQGIRLCEEVREFVDIIEIGTPLIIRSGMDGVRRFRERFPEKELLADAKIMDAGGYEAQICFEAGVDYVTVLGVTDIRTIKGCVEVANRYDRKRVVADMICVQDVEARVALLEEAGIRDIAVHTGVDMQAAGRTPLEDLKRIRSASGGSVISVAGGISVRTVDAYKENGADVVIVGGGIARAEDPAAAAKAIAMKLK